ncbi:MAG: helicase, partial [Deltaproteobacteria bacterium]|nr:helicase [Deltaproteobacteria bacterium]
MKPEFIDNTGGNTLASALNGYLDELSAKLKAPVELRVASGYFNPQGFALVADRLARLHGVKLLLGAEPTPPPAVPLRMPGDPRGPRFEQGRLRDALGKHDEGLRRDRDRIPFAPAEDAGLRGLVELLRSGHVEVRRYESAFLHGKAYIFGGEEGTFVGSSNFTFAGLRTNLELNLGEYQPHVVSQVAAWFERLWAEAVPYDLAALYEARQVPHEPYLVYLRVLWELFGRDLHAGETTSELNLTAFQRDGVWRAERILQELGGVLVADEVGLGKTFLAGDLIRIALKHNRQRVLVVAPAALRDGPWEAFLARYMLRDAEVVSFEQLQRDERLDAGGSGAVLRPDPNDYALVVVDEAQACRNPEALRSRALRALLRGRPRKRLVLMSATPVNNSVWDLHTLLGYFLDNDGVFADRGIPSLLKQFRQIAAHDPEDLHPNALFDVLDATTVRRTRHFVKRYYPNETIRAADGSSVQIRFPKPVVLPVSYDLDAALPGIFDRIRDALAPSSGHPQLTLARYAPNRYRKSPAADPDQTAALVGLLRAGILKRFESSQFAFEQTLQTLVRGCEAFLKGLDEGRVLRGRGLAEIEDLSDLDDWQDLVRDATWDPVAEYDATGLRAAVEQDRQLFAELLAAVQALPTADNPKLHALDHELGRIAAQAEREGRGDERDRRKAVVFTFFEDTAEWIYEHLVKAIARRKDLAAYRGRIACVSGGRTWGGVTRDEAVFGFAPRSMEAPKGRDADRFDVLITTDILAEGMNLQQCRHIINFDLPWNPMRLVQRHGRVDRIGSPHDTI